MAKPNHVLELETSYQQLICQRALFEHFIITSDSYSIHPSELIQGVKKVIHPILPKAIFRLFIYLVQPTESDSRMGLSRERKSQKNFYMRFNVSRPYKYHVIVIIYES